MKSIVVGLMVFVALGALSGTAFAQRMKLGEVLVLTVPDLKPEADTKAFEQQARAQDVHLFRADRGGRKGQYLLASTKPFVSAGGQQQEYQLIGGVRAPLPEVEILGIHYTKVRPDRRGAFEKFIAAKIHPAVGNVRPDIRMLYYKPVRGADEGTYLAVFALTRASRDRYWPGGSDSDDLRAAFSPAIRELAKELRTFLVDGSYADDPKLAASVYESREWTDYVVIPGR